MKPRPSNWVLILSKAGKRLKVFPLAEDSVVIGRDAENEISLPYAPVSRRHAEIARGPDGVTVRDLGSRNGVLVNGVPRKAAVLQAGDRLTICDFELELVTSVPSETTLAATPIAGLAAALGMDQTIEQRVRLPEAGHERQLVALYHVCFWAAEGLEEAAFVERCVGLLLEAFRADEVQVYSAERRMTTSLTVDGGNSRLRLAAFLAGMFQESKEATGISGRDIARHQRGVGDYNYLVGPLRGGATPIEPAPFVVVIRTGDHADFTPEDRVLLQAICQLWARGLAKTNQMAELRRQNAVLQEKFSRTVPLGGSPAMTDLLARARKAAATHATVLLTGETGSGKEVLAQFLHENSPRRNGPLVKLNCAAIPESLIESELFGYAKGAFSGAVRDHRGKFAQAGGGTLFLDEIGEMPLAVQAKVLRAIENREVQPLGSDETMKVDIRVIAATHRDLAALVRERAFREDLYYRLDVQTIHLPPLRDRAGDLAELVPHFLQKTCAENGLADMAFAPDAIEALAGHDWPGNVRELWNVVQRCALAAENLIITKAEALAQVRRPLNPR